MRYATGNENIISVVAPPTDCPSRHALWGMLLHLHSREVALSSVQKKGNLHASDKEPSFFRQINGESFIGTPALVRL